ncbi:cyclase family protein [Natrinema sp. SYSU A 869]|uniref:cyclase family protein n=1 Tax=Natrinema sp. SYSU A 869 TaxID=2871694 RepID=UPI001CA3C7EB|nr:cyclase family protein [Natrinema sp. SYSU A 869]
MTDDPPHTDWIDLTQPFDGDIPHSAALPAPEFETISDVDRDGVNAQWVGTPTHVGTHVDAPRHMIADGATIDEFPLERFAGPATVIDVAREESEPITAAELAAATDDVRSGDILLIRTGWGDRYDCEEYERYPWLAADVGDWLLEQGVKLLAVDTPSPDRPRATRPDGWDEYPIHYALLSEGVLIAEHLSIPASLAGTRPTVFGFPLSLDGGDGAPARFVATPTASP